MTRDELVALVIPWLVAAFCLGVGGLAVLALTAVGTSVHSTTDRRQELRMKITRRARLALMGLVVTAIIIGVASPTLLPWTGLVL